MNGLPLLTLLTALPLLGAAIAIFSGKHARSVAILTTGASLALAIYARDARHPAVLYKQAQSLDAELLATGGNRVEGLHIKSALALIDNQPGAGATIGGAALARSPADGYTLMVGSMVDYSIAPYFHQNLSFDMAKDFVPILEIGNGTIGVLVTPSLPHNSSSAP